MAKAEETVTMTKDELAKLVAQIKAETRMFRVCWELSYAELLSRV